MEGVVIGTYRVQRKLGEGGMGAVYQAEHTLLGRRAAIKVLLPALSANQEIVNRFFNEARATTSIADPGIVQVFDFGYHTDGSAYIVMEYLEGESLDGRLRRLGHFAPADALRLTRQITSSLQSAHGKGIVHRDLKPENIFVVGDPAVTGGERPKILDFGIAKLAGDEPGRMKTRTGALIGTPVYMSPEQCRGAGDIDHRSDIYALGCVLFCMLTGRPPFDGEGMGEIIAAHLREPAPPPSRTAPGLPPFIDELVLRCLAKSPAERFQTMQELGQAIGVAESMLLGNPPYPYSTHATPPPHGQYPSQPYLSRPQSQSHLSGGPYATPAPQPMPGAAGAVTTLATASGQTGVGSRAGQTMAPARGRGALFAGLGVAVVGVGVALFFVLGSGDKAGAGQSGTPDAGMAAIAPPPPALDAAVAVTPPPPALDAAVIATATIDAGAGVIVPPTTVDAGAPRSVDAGSQKPKKPRKPRKDKDAGSSAGTGYVDRGD